MDPQFTLVCPQRGSILCNWQPNHNLYLASVGANNRVTITDKRNPKSPIFSFDIAGVCTGLSWDPEGEILAVVQDATGTVYLWDSALALKATTIESNWKGLQQCIWSNDGNILACGSQKGNLLLYHRNWSKKIPILGKHKRSITDMAWITSPVEQQQLLACLSEDQTFTISNKDGDTLAQGSANGFPSLLKYAVDERNDQTLLSFIAGGHSLCRMYNPTNNTPSIKSQSFPSKYGNIIGAHWLTASDSILLVFTGGIIVEASTADSDFGMERQQMRHFKDNVVDSAFSENNNQLAILGDHYLKIIDAENIQVTITMITLESERGMLDKVCWSSDGQYLTTSSKSGRAYTYLCHLPVIFSVYGTLIATLSSLTEISVFDAPLIINESNTDSVANIETPDNCMKITISTEPLLLGVGPKNVVTASNNRMCIFDALNLNSPPIMRDFPSALKSISINHGCYAAISGDRVYLGNLIDAGNATYTVYPIDDGSASITSMSLTDDFLIIGTETGTIRHYLIEDENQGISNDYSHEFGIKSLYPNINGTLVLFIDSHYKAYLLNAVDGNTIPIPVRKEETVKGVLWHYYKNSSHRQSFLVYDSEEEMRFFSYTDCSIKDENLQYIGKKRLPHGLDPILFYENVIICMSSSGKLVQLKMDKFDDVLHSADLEKYLLGDMKEFWKSMRSADAEGEKQWRALAMHALSEMDLQVAAKIFRHLKDLDILYSLQSMSDIEDKKLLSGHIAVALSDFGKAQEFFLASTRPLEALNLRCDLLQWDESLQLATKLAPEEVPVISAQYAQHLESHGSIEDAKQMYMNAFESNTALREKLSSKMKWQATQRIAQDGLARTTLKSGDIPLGMRFTHFVKDRKVLFECASILEGLKQTQEAAFLFEKAQFYDKAAELYIKVKNFAKVGELLPNLESTKIYFQYAKAKEAEGNYEEAVKGYEKAKDYENLVRLLVEHLRKINEAVEIVRATRSPESAKIVAKYFQSTKDYKAVIEFCLLAGLAEEAMSYAQNNDQMDYYAKLIEKTADKATLSSIATYFEQRNQNHLAGKYFMKAGDHNKAILYLLQTNEPEAIDMAIELAGTIKSEPLTKKLLGFLNGDRDGVPKDKTYVFKLYLAIQDYKLAADTALEIANSEQSSGRYKQSHDLLFKCYKALQKAGVKIPHSLYKMLALVHSYILVKPLIKMDDHEKGSRMLIRVANSISHFPMHSVAILTSTVIECHRSGMKRSAFEYASTLVRPEYRNQIDPKFKRKIELIVRRPEIEEIDENQTPCPFCSAPLQESCLDCGACKSGIPYCIASGLHMVKSNWSVCPSCDFPALYSQFKPFIQANGSCPMCDTPLNAEQIQLVDGSEYLRRHKQEF